MNTQAVKRDRLARLEAIITNLRRSSSEALKGASQRCEGKWNVEMASATVNALVNLRGLSGNAAGHPGLPGTFDTLMGRGTCPVTEGQCLLIGARIMFLDALDTCSCRSGADMARRVRRTDAGDGTMVEMI